MKTFKRQRRADLHMHTLFSDGHSTPTELVDMATSANLAAISITDHDTMDAFPDIQDYGDQQGVLVIPGIELSTTYHDKDVHILGYFVDPTHPQLADIIFQCKHGRYERAQKIVENLNDQGVQIEFERVKYLAGDGTIARPHIAQALIETGYVGTAGEAFQRFIGYHNDAYVDKFRLSPADAFEVIEAAGGISVWAHPGTLKREDWIPEFAEMGMNGIEAFHPNHSYKASRHYVAIARHLGLITTGGTDFHGDAETSPGLGSISVSYEVVEEMQLMIS